MPDANCATVVAAIFFTSPLLDLAAASNHHNRLLYFKAHTDCLGPYSCRTQSSLPDTLYGSSEIRGRNVRRGGTPRRRLP
jgi:hypothetical protein